MSGLIIASVLVVLVALGALMALRRNRVVLPPKDVLDRVKARERELEAKEQDD